MSIRLYVGNLPKEPIERKDLQAVFADAGDAVSTKVIKDRKTGKCRGFAFVTVPTDEMANELIEKHNGQAFMDTTLKIEKALPRAKSKPEGGDETSESAPKPITNVGSSGSSKRSDRGNKAKRNDRSSSSSSTSTANAGGVQPDPRWADELAKLKEMLSAQATNS
ncbi:RNA-binding protein [Oscillatoria sp. FACHB-1406]|uniref:RNA recognition motif domain-containing protein n=1 Tax=Oscillatoria sp. FACHB-1406 TaxID=2692846 RepID=UPI001684B3A9|nr:RNA-binding protein [Oscillatoria sp. FACHB-1406]MBD2578148.1 RNA-binding protein [Oscillatoria sp. FACHB-1406]